MTQIKMEDGESIDDIRGKIKSITGIESPEWWRSMFSGAEPRPRSAEQRARYRKKFDFPVDDYYSEDDEEDEDEEDGYGDA